MKAGQVGTSNSTKPKNLGTFEYAHLRAPLPKGIVSGIFHPSPSSYFLMRRISDGFISATGMFKASFPYAEVAEEEMERKYIKSLPTTSPDETAGNVWIPPQQALDLAEEYQIYPWIKALLDDTPIEINPTLDLTPRSSIAPPESLMPQKELTAPTPTRGRPRRSASPSKIASPRKVAGSTRGRKSKSECVEPSAKAASKNMQEALRTAVAEPEASSAMPKAEAREEQVVRVNVDTEVRVKDDIETTHTHVEVEMPAGSPDLPLPEDTEAMIAKAKEMVETAVANSNGAPFTNSKQSKRKADVIEEEEEEEAVKEAATPAKKAKTEITELKKERIKTRTLLGITATLAVAYVVF